MTARARSVGAALLLGAVALASGGGCASFGSEDSASSTSAESGCETRGKIDVCGKFLSTFRLYHGPYPRVGEPKTRVFSSYGDHFQVFERVVMNESNDHPCGAGIACITLIGIDDAQEHFGTRYDGVPIGACDDSRLVRRDVTGCLGALGGDLEKANALRKELKENLSGYYGNLISAVQPTCDWWNGGSAPTHYDCFWMERSKVGRAADGTWEFEALGAKRYAHGQIPGAPVAPPPAGAEPNAVRDELLQHGHVVLDHIADEAALRNIVVNIPDGRWERGNSYYAILDDGRIFYKSWLYLLQITGWDDKPEKKLQHRPTRARIVGATARETSSWSFADRLVPPSSSTAVVLGTWESEADNALSMKWIPSKLPLGAVVLPSKQTLSSNFATETQPEAYAGLIQCNKVLTSDAAAAYASYDEVRSFEGAWECNDAEADRDHVLALFRDEVGPGARPTLIVGISAGTFVAQHLGEKLGGVETHLFGTPRYACKAGSGIGCDGGIPVVQARDDYKDIDAQMPYCANGPTLAGFPYVYYRNNPHDGVPGSFDNSAQVLFHSNGWHDYSNWAFVGGAGADRFARTSYEACGYPVPVGGHPDCGGFPATLRGAANDTRCCDKQGCR